jgi:hypothetical protein
MYWTVWCRAVIRLSRDQTRRTWRRVLDAGKLQLKNDGRKFF